MPQAPVVDFVGSSVLAQTRSLNARQFFLKIARGGASATFLVSIKEDSFVEKNTHFRGAAGGAGLLFQQFFSVFLFCIQNRRFFPLRQKTDSIFWNWDDVTFISRVFFVFSVDIFRGIRYVTAIESIFSTC